MSSVACDMEEVSSETSRRVQEEETLKPLGLLLQKGKKKRSGGWTRRGNGDAGSHSFVERGGRRLREP